MTTLYRVNTRLLHMGQVSCLSPKGEPASALTGFVRFTQVARKGLSFNEGLRAAWVTASMRHDGQAEA